MGHTQKIPDSELENVKHLHYDEGKTLKQIGDVYNCGSSSVSRYFRKHGLKGISPHGRNRIDPGKEALAKDIENGLTNRQIATKYTASIQAVCNWMHKYGFDVNRHVFRYSEILPPDKLLELQKECSTDREVAKKSGVPFKSLSLLRKKYAIPNPYKPVSPGYNKLFELYIVKELNQAQIAEELGVNKVTISAWLAKCGIRKRNRAEQIQLALDNGAWSDTAMKGRHTMIKNRVLKGSAPQQAVLGFLITSLEPLHEQGYEVVIGQQNWCILNGSLEVDIPIVVMKNGCVIKIAIEVDGIYWHKDDLPIIKNDRLRDKGWIPFHFIAEEKTIKQMAPDIQVFCSSIHDYILSH